MSRPKYRIGMFVEFKDEANNPIFGRVIGIVITEQGYRVRATVADREFEINETSIASAYRPIVLRKRKQKTARVQPLAATGG